MWQNIDEFSEALDGKFGEEEQATAMQFAEESGLLDQAEAAEQAEASQDYDDALEQEFQRLEVQIGRKLTRDEEQALLDSISTQEAEQGFVTDFTAEYGPQLESARYTEDGRVHLAASAAEEAFERMAAEEEGRQASLEPAQPAGGVDRSDYAPAGYGQGDE